MKNELKKLLADYYKKVKALPRNEKRAAFKKFQTERNNLLAKHGRRYDEDYGIVTKLQ